MKHGIMKIKINNQSIIMFLLALFLITKVIRTFSGAVDTVGGIWNVVQSVFLLIGLMWSLKYFPTYRKEYPIVILVLFDLYVFLLATPKFELSLSGVFNIFMLLYAACIFVLFFIVGMRTDLREKSLIPYIFYIVTIIIIFSMIRWFLSGSRASFIKLIDVADVYYPLGLMPLVLVFTKKKYSYIPLLFLATALVFTGKRAGILALVMMALVFYLSKNQKEKVRDSIKKVITIVAIGAIMYYLAIYLDNYFNLRLISRLYSMTEDGGSGRIERWISVINALRQSDVFNLLFGHGWGSVKNILGGHAHNDFLEIFYEFGIFAALLYISFYFSLIIKLFQMIKCKYRYVAEYTASLICSLFLTLFSFYFIKPFYITCGMLCFGFFLSDFKKFMCEKRGLNHVDIQS